MFIAAHGSEHALGDWVRACTGSEHALGDTSLPLGCGQWQSAVVKWQWQSVVDAVAFSGGSGGSGQRQ